MTTLALLKVQVGSIDIYVSKQLNAAPYVRTYIGGVHGISLAHYYGKRLCHWSQFHVCTSFGPRLLTVVFGLGTGLHVRIRTMLENDVILCLLHMCGQ